MTPGHGPSNEETDGFVRHQESIVFYFFGHGLAEYAVAVDGEVDALGGVCDLRRGAEDDRAPSVQGPDLRCGAL
jgi:hypothetical protein